MKLKNSILDCTLRDGGHVNNFNFGKQIIERIVDSLVSAKIDIIELGFLKNISYNPDYSLFSTPEDADWLLEKYYKKDVIFGMMIRPDQYSGIENICESKYVKLIRLAFHIQDFKKALSYYKILKDKGYKISLNPVNTAGMSKDELIKVTKGINDIEPDIFSIVDTYGSLSVTDSKNLIHFFDKNITQSVDLGFHTHENMSTSVAMAIEFFSNTKVYRNKIVDASLLGMGRIPGNLCLENLILQIENGLDIYNISPLLSIINDIMLPLKSKFSWGYHPAYAYSAKKHVSRNYVEYYLNKHFDLISICKLIDKISTTEERRNFSSNFAEQIVLEK